MLALQRCVTNLQGGLRGNFGFCGSAICFEGFEKSWQGFMLMVQRFEIFLQGRMIPEGLRYGLSIGTGYPEEKLPGKLGQKSKKLRILHECGREKSWSKTDQFAVQHFAKLTQKSARIWSETLFLIMVFKEISGQIFSSFSGGSRIQNRRSHIFIYFL